MKKFVASLVAVTAVTLALAASAFAWHADGVKVKTTCITPGYTYQVGVEIIQNAQYPATLFSVTPSSFPGNTTGTKSVVVVVKFTNGEKQTFNTSVTLDGKCVAPPPPDPNCPEGYTKVSFKDGVLLCTKETVRTETKTETVYVDRPVEKIVEKVVYVDKPVEVIKEVKVPGPIQKVTKTVVQVKNKIKTKIVNHYRVVKPKAPTCPVPKPNALPPTR